jgi:hypothetical protein
MQTTVEDVGVAGVQVEENRRKDAAGHDSAAHTHTHRHTDTHTHTHTHTVVEDLGVVGAQVEKQLAIHREDATRHDRAAHCRNLLHRTDKVPLDVRRDEGEGQAPVEAALDGRPPAAARMQAEVMRADGAEGRYDHARAVLVDAGQQRLQPADGHLGVTVNEDDDVIDGFLGAADARTHNTVVHVSFDDADDGRQESDVLLQKLQLLQRAVVVNWGCRWWGGCVCVCVCV